MGASISGCHAQPQSFEETMPRRSFVPGIPIVVARLRLIYRDDRAEPGHDGARERYLVIH
jgi:hypothetical protein